MSDSPAATVAVPTDAPTATPQAAEKEVLWSDTISLSVTCTASSASLLRALPSLSCVPLKPRSKRFHAVVTANQGIALFFPDLEHITQHLPGTDHLVRAGELTFDQFVEHNFTTATVSSRTLALIRTDVRDRLYITINSESCTVAYEAFLEYSTATQAVHDRNTFFNLSASRIRMAFEYIAMNSCCVASLCPVAHASVVEARQREQAEALAIISEYNEKFENLDTSIMRAESLKETLAVMISMHERHPPAEIVHCVSLGDDNGEELESNI
jgi:hypothetical protein